MVKHIGIIGEGKMGTNLLHYLLGMEFNLTWICSRGADPEKLSRNIQKRLTRSFEAGIFNEVRFKQISEGIKISENPEDLASCELIIEAIPEDRISKRELFRKLDEVIAPGCIFTSNSSSIIPTDLCPSETRKDKFIGLHFFYPVALRDIVEIMVTQETSEETMKQVVSFLGSIGRRFIVLKEKESFILNRIFLHFQNEAFLMVEEKKASIHQVDRIVKEHFFPTGVFEFFDSVGLDVMLASVENYSRMEPEPEKFHPLIEKLQALVSAGRLGIKTKRGFFGDDIPADPGLTENDDLVISRLRKSWEQALLTFSELSGIPRGDLKAAMDEYFGAETPIC